MRSPMSAFTLVAACSLSACVERVPSELRPDFTSLVLPSNFCDRPLDAVERVVRNVGDDAVTIASITFVADDTSPETLASFDAPTFDRERLLAEEESIYRFTYRTPGGLSQRAILVVTSDAVVNPTLQIPVETEEFAPDNAAQLCAGGEGEGEGEGGT